MNGSVILSEGMEYRPDIALAANTTLVKNEAVAVQSAQLKPATSGLLTSGGAPVLFLGIAVATCANPAATAEKVSPLPLLRRGITWECELDPADPPTTAELFQNVALSTPKSVKKTIASGDEKFKLLELLPGNRALVWVPPPSV